MMAKGVIGVYVKHINLLQHNIFLWNLTIEGFLFDKKSGEIKVANTSSSNINLYESPFIIKKKENINRYVDSGYQLLVIQEHFSILESENKIFFFEICKNEKCEKNQDVGKVRVAWAFLIPVASDGSSNTNKDLKLQLYKIRRNCKISHQQCNIFHLYSDHKLKKLFGFLSISVKEILPTNIRLKNADKNADNAKLVTGKKVNTDFPIESKTSFEPRQWTRLPGRSCKVPNKIHKIIPFGKRPVSFLRFSRSGVNVAVAALSRIFVLEVPFGEEVAVFQSHFGFIYELDWSLDDKLLLSVSNDCRAVVWSLVDKTFLFSLPHPSYVYCGRWLGNDNTQIITGGKDRMIRYWCRNSQGFDLVEEMSGHPGFVSALTTRANTFVFSGDSQGCLMIRKVFKGRWSLIKTLSFSQISHSVIDTIHVHSNRRIILSVRRRGSYLVDVVSEIILQTYGPANNPFARSISSMTPCGSFLFSFSHNGDINVWEINTGKLFAVYHNLYSVSHLAELSGCIDYHPYEHLVGFAALFQNSSLSFLKYEKSNLDDSNKIGLTYEEW